MKKNKKKILIIIPSFFPALKYGGPIYSTFRSLVNLSLHNYFDITVFTTNSNKDEKLNVEVNRTYFYQNLSVKYFNDNFSNRLSISLVIQSILMLKKFDIIHLQSFFSLQTLIILIACKVLGKKTLISPRGQLGDWALKKKK